MDSLSGEEFVFLSLSVETNIDAATLASYAGQNNFPQMFAVATPEMLNALVGQFGRTISNPPSTPHFIIAPDGTVSALSTGIHSAEEIAAQVRAAQGGS
jgi:hypothetical protein